MKQCIDRREFLKLAGVGGAVFASGLYPLAGQAQSAGDFFFVQLSDFQFSLSNFNSFCPSAAKFKRQ